MTEYQEWAKVYKKDYPLQAAQIPTGRAYSLYMAVGDDQKIYVAYRKDYGPLEVVGEW